MRLTPVMPPSRRHSVRRAVDLSCRVRSELWKGPVRLAMRDLSPEGLWLASSFVLDPGMQVMLAFRPPRWAVDALPVIAVGEVTRVDLRRRRSDSRPSGMGVRFIDITHTDQDRMHRGLRGMPPPLPPRPRPEPLARVDAETSFTLEDGQTFSFRPLGPMLTLARPVLDGSLDESTLPSALRLAG